MVAAISFAPLRAWRVQGSRLCSRVWEQNIESVDARLFVRMTKTKRLRAGWFVALIYMLCVLAPAISFALPGSQAVSPCLTDASHVPGMVEVSTRHVHNDGHVHDHSGGHSHANSAGDYRAMSMALNTQSVPEKAPHSSDGQCCGLMCVTALPATLLDIVKPSAPTALCEVEGTRKVADNAPPRHYRPPIS